MSENVDNLQKLLNKAAELKKACIILSAASKEASTGWSNIFTWLGIPNAILAGLSSVSIATGNEDTRLYSTIVSIIVAVLTALITFLNPSDKMKAYHDASRSYEAMGEKFEDFCIKYQIIDDVLLAECAEELSQLKQEYEDVRNKQPFINERNKEKARKNLEATTAHKAESGVDMEQESIEIAVQVRSTAKEEIAVVKKIISKIKQFKDRQWSIGLTIESLQPDGFFRFFEARNLSLKSFVQSQGVTIGDPSAYDENIATLEQYISEVRKQEIAACQEEINELETYKANYWAIGLNGDTLQQDGFGKFFSDRGLEFKYFVRSQGVEIGDPTAYDENILTLNKYMGPLSA